MARKKQLEVSNQLLSFIEKRFQSMVNSEKKLEECRSLYRRELEKREQKKAVRIKRKFGSTGEMNPNPFSTVWKAMDAGDITLKGKAKLDLNNFVYMCDYLLQNENQEALGLEKFHWKDIHGWISRFLTQKGYRKRKGKTYTSNDIRGIVNKQFENPRKNISKELHHWWSIFDNEFKEFCSSKPPEKSKNMTDKEVNDQIHKWNEEAISEIEKDRKSQTPLS